MAPSRSWPILTLPSGKPHGAYPNSMQVHHYYPRTRNIGDHFVQQGIERMIRELRPDAAFKLFNVNSQGEQQN